MSSIGPPVVPVLQAARMILSRAALAGPRAPSSPKAVAAMVRRLGYVQIDSIAAVERAHNTILRTRLAGYRENHLRLAAERDRAIFEHWTHDASFVPAEWIPYWHQRFRRYARKRRDHDPALMRRVLAAVRRNGPTRARDVGGEGSGSGGWWGWSPQKAALEALWRSGRLAVAHRAGFQKSYDIFERVHSEIEHPPADAAEHRHWACSEALARLGVGTPREIAAFFGDLDSRDVEQWATTKRGRALVVRVLRARADGGQPELAFAMEDALDARHSAPSGVRLLSPFDPVVRDRRRLEHVWNFSYRFEAFVPAAKRVDGYYTLPVLDGERFMGRCALRADRKAGTLTLERWRAESARAARGHPNGAGSKLPGRVGSAIEDLAAELELTKVDLSTNARRRAPAH